MTRRPTGAHRPGTFERLYGDDSCAESTAPLHVPELAAPELTEAECRRCGTYIAGLDGRYACGVCGWVNDHSEGHRRLPRADEDPDRPPKGRRRPRQLPEPAPELTAELSAEPTGELPAEPTGGRPVEPTAELPAESPPGPRPEPVTGG
ncbi:hypothetical protein [Streptomyces sp. NBC_00503]|uniref:hypothetical protein n=1 Tax=Streptomyces sp. NBC_00503 TaxID=2903659 RepID=UPI002E8209BB|nr:hypothetical protein [Streptomyces sp. NBC_00503]WUD81015.1 hypothetical protein OG490_10905 [Streptomyces sp. NBC_00503]